KLIAAPAQDQDTRFTLELDRKLGGLRSIATTSLNEVCESRRSPLLPLTRYYPARESHGYRFRRHWTRCWICRRICARSCAWICPMFVAQAPAAAGARCLCPPPGRDMPHPADPRREHGRRCRRRGQGGGRRRFRCRLQCRPGAWRNEPLCVVCRCEL